MRQQGVQLDVFPALGKDPRWQLVERIVASPSFIRSPRLCSLLMHLCELALEGRSDEINEQSIGEALFERAPNYDPSVDGIVRSHASRLRQRLDQYFSEEGEHETVRLTIPKGGYTPLFEPHSLPVLPLESAVPAPSSASASIDQPTNAAKKLLVSNRYRLLFWATGVALIAACVFIFVLLTHTQFARPVPAPKHTLFGALSSDLIKRLLSSHPTRGLQVFKRSPAQTSVWPNISAATIELTRLLQPEPLWRLPS
jgi:hypothetical protein